MKEVYCKVRHSTVKRFPRCLNSEDQVYLMRPSFIDNCEKRPFYSENKYPYSIKVLREY